MIMVIVNSQVYGGSGGGVATFSLAAGANEIALHEMGHTAFGFADEYDYFRGLRIGRGRPRSLCGRRAFAAQRDSEHEPRHAQVARFGPGRNSLAYHFQRELRAVRPAG